MIRFIRKNGFFGIFLLSAWPNAAFDLCGLACGSFRMPFATFFGATLLGKGVAKVNGQVCMCTCHVFAHIHRIVLCICVRWRAV